MGNANRGKFDFKVDEETYSLHFTANGMCELEDAAGCSTIKFLNRLGEQAEDDLSMGDVRLLFWAGLQEHHPELTVRDAGKLITGLGGLMPALELAGKAVSAAMPEPDQKKTSDAKGAGEKN